MKRRSFNAAAGAVFAAPAQTRPRRNELMHVGGDYHSVAGGPGADPTGKENLEYNLRHGVKHLTIQMPRRAAGWDLADLKRMRENCDRFGVVFEAIRMDSNYIKFSKGPDRDRELQAIAGNIRKAAEIGVKIITYHWTLIPIRRNRETPGRGGSTYHGFKLESDWRNLPAGESGRVTADDYWERITYFLQRVIPVAKESGVRMACHPYDPPGLPFGYQGADNWDSPAVLDAIKRYEAIAESPHNGFQLCLGTVGEGLKNPRADILPIVRYLGERGKIHQIHMRNIKGALYDFEEVYPDEGVMNFLEVMRILRDTRFSGSICPDHMPRHPGDSGGLQAFAFGYGYLHSLIQTVNSEV